ncbi:MAG TPA: VOC family protein [Oceanobacillus sp.]|nr:VOC family protein [Oceanobacillus sp.]
MDISHVGTVSVFVSDQQRAKEFYTNVLGFELRTDAPLGPDSEARWIAVAPKGAQTELVLYLPDEYWEHYKQTVGKPQAFTLHVKDMQKVHAELKSKGVTFIQEPDIQPWGSNATICDSEGNHILLVEPAK